MKRAHTSKIDFMSNLPEELLLDIMRLSSMKARAAVQTCVLSKRWTHLWEFLPHLDFDLTEFNSGDPEQDEQRFSRFVTSMLECCKIHILHKFRLSFCNLCKNQHGSSIRKWVAYAIQHQVRMLELDVCLCDANTVMIDYVFACDSIEELHLHLSHCHPAACLFGTEKVNLPRVRKLQLNSWCFTHSDFTSYLISGCPLLEELWLESFNLPVDSTISSQKLKHLTLKNCGFITELTIIAPNLVSLCFFGSIVSFQTLINQCGSPSSLTISVVCSVPGFYDSYIFPSKYVLSRLESLEFCVPKSKNAPRPESPSFYTAYNLKKLSICGHSFDRFPCIWKYLPNLEKLTLWSSCQHSKEQYSEVLILQGLKWDDVLQRAINECRRLKMVDVVFPIYDDHERKLVEDLRQLGDVEIVMFQRDDYVKIVNNVSFYRVRSQNRGEEKNSMEYTHTSELVLVKYLPEELLLQIMGLMKTRVAVQTCMLTKQWNHLWPLLSVLDFNSKDPEQDKERFSRFVTTMLECRKAVNLHKFRLSCADLCEEQYCLSVKKWIMYAIEHQVRVLELTVCRRMLALNIFDCNSVEELHLHLCKCSCSISIRFTMLTRKIDLPRLRKLQLHGKYPSGPKFLTNLILGCPLLEELWIESFNVPLGSKIYSKSLRSLTFKNCRGIYKLDIRAENLISLCFIGLVDDFMRICYQCRSTRKTTRSLTHATVSILTDSYCHFSLNTILDDLSHVANLKLCVSKSTPDSQLLSYGQTIPNLKELSFCGYSLDYFPCIWKYLHNLEKLNLWLFCRHSHKHYQESLNWDGALQVALTECKKLKVVEVVCAILDDQTKQLVENLRQLTDVEIVISEEASN